MFIKKFAFVLAFLASLTYSKAALFQFDVNMSGAQETSPPTGSLGIGGPTSAGSVNFDDVTKLFSVDVTYSGLGANASAAHVHSPAAAGASANPLFGLTGASGTSGRITGSATYTTQQQSDLFNGLQYVNIHTTAFPNGEIRGQILNPTAVPEPQQYALLAGIGMLGFAGYRRYRDQAA